MSGTMSQEDLVADLKAMLGDAAGKFLAVDDGDFKRQLDFAALDLDRFGPTYATGSVELVADLKVYDAPADCKRMSHRLYGDTDRAEVPWARSWSGVLPTPMLVRNGSAMKLMLSPAPSAAMISALGSTFEFLYVIRYAIGVDAQDTTVPLSLRGLLLVRAVSEAMSELANKNISKPVQLGSSPNGISMPKNGHPAALAQDLLGLCEKMAVAA